MSATARSAELISLEGRVAVVTGGAKGIGLAIAKRLGDAGAAVVIGDLDEAEAVAAAEALATDGRKVVGAALDVADEASIVALADRAVAEFGTIDVWVNNAGIYPVAPAVDMPIEQWDLVIDVNLRGTFLGGREAARRMIADGHGGVIVNIASTAGDPAASGRCTTRRRSTPFGASPRPWRSSSGLTPSGCWRWRPA